MSRHLSSGDVADRISCAHTHKLGGCRNAASTRIVSPRRYVDGLATSFFPLLEKWFLITSRPTPSKLFSNTDAAVGLTRHLSFRSVINVFIFSILHLSLRIFWKRVFTFLSRCDIFLFLSSTRSFNCSFVGDPGGCFFTFSLRFLIALFSYFSFFPLIFLCLIIWCWSFPRRWSDAGFIDEKYCWNRIFP